MYNALFTFNRYIEKPNTKTPQTIYLFKCLMATLFIQSLPSIGIRYKIINQGMKTCFLYKHAFVLNIH